MKAFLAGIGVGTTLAIFLAPDSGEATRRRIIDRLSNWNKGPSRKAVSRPEHSRRKTGEPQDASFSSDSQESEREAPGSKKGQGTANPSQADSINVLSRDELMTVNGIGPVLADRIISGRPYSSRKELVERGIIAQSTLEQLEREFGSRKRRA